MANKRGKGGSTDRFPLLGLQNHGGWWVQPWNQKMIASWQESDDKPRQCVEKQRYYSANKGPYSQGYSLPSGHVWLWELGYKEGRTPKNWCLQTVVLEKIPENPLGSKEIKPVNLKEINPEYSMEGLILKLKLQYLVIWCEQTTHWKSPWCWQRSKAEEEGFTGWEGWTASLMQWIWTWSNSRRWWGTGRPGMGLQRVGCDWVSKHQQQYGSKQVLRITVKRNSSMH